MIDILEINAFPDDEILAGLTLSNFENYENGFSIGNSDFYTACKVNQMKNDLALQIKKVYAQSDLIFQFQTHSDIVKIVDENYSFGESDALITNLRDKVINISIADCAGILLYDNKNKVIAGVHSGWKGTNQKIVVKTLELMQSRFNSEMNDITAYISPCAGGDVYEVGEDVARFFPNSINQISNSKYLFDNRNEIKIQLFSQGVRKENIFVSSDCTIKDKRFHSFRREGLSSGRMSVFIMMK